MNQYHCSPGARRSLTLWLVCVTVATAVLVALVCHRQPLVRADGAIDDGLRYLQLEQLFREHAPIRERAPFVYRVGTPWLAAQLPFSNIESMAWLTIGTNVLTVPVLFAFFAIHLRRTLLAAILAFAYAGLYLGPVRFGAWYPTLTDSPNMLAIALGLLAVGLRTRRRNPSAATMVFAAVVCGLGVLVRESVLLVGIAYAACWRPPRSMNRLGPSLRSLAMSLVPLACGLLAFACVKRMVTPSDDRYTFATTAIEFAFAKPLPRLVLPIFIVFGPAVAVLAAFPSSTWKALRQLRWTSVVIGIDLVLSIIGGSDTERFLVWAVPAVFLLAGRIAERRFDAIGAPLPAALLALGYALTQRVAWSLPRVEDPRVPSLSSLWLSPQGTSFGFSHLKSFHVAETLCLAWIGQQLVFVAVFVVAARYTAARAATRRTSARKDVTDTTPECSG
jgi:hypothetical protein